MRLTLGVALAMCNLHLQAHQFDLEYNTELQTNFKGDYNWVNLLHLHGSVNVTKNLTVEAATISIAKTNKEPLIDDLQGYSNIEEQNLPLGIAVLGAEYRNRRSTFFLGIRNVNEDYFTSPVTSLFINSSCGIFPTLSANYDIANYPLSSWCFHYKVEWEKIVLQTSIYEGRGHSRIFGHDNVFKFSPKRDGMFSITSLEYDNNGSNYSLGCAVYYGMHNTDEIIIQEETPQTSPQTTATAKKSLSVSPWLNLEQRLTDAWSAMLQASYSTSKDNCLYYFGLGTSYTIGNAQLGLFADYAKFNECSEVAAEVTCHLQLTPQIALQPAIEVIRTGNQTNVIGISRLSINI